MKNRLGMAAALLAFAESKDSPVGLHDGLFVERSAPLRKMREPREQGTRERARRVRQMARDRKRQDVE